MLLLDHATIIWSQVWWGFYQPISYRSRLNSNVRVDGSVLSWYIKMTLINSNNKKYDRGDRRSGTYNLSSVFSILLLKATVAGWKLLAHFLTINFLWAQQRKSCCLGKCHSVSPIIFIIICLLKLSLLCYRNYL